MHRCKAGKDREEVDGFPKRDLATIKRATLFKTGRCSRRVLREVSQAQEMWMRGYVFKVGL